MPNPVTGLTHAAAALRYYERRQETAANNLANVSTDGFRGERAFATLLSDGVVAARTATDASAGLGHAACHAEADAAVAAGDDRDAAR